MCEVVQRTETMHLFNISAAECMLCIC